MNTRERILLLQNKHSDLDQELLRENKYPYPDDLIISDLKRKKLRIKDELILLNKNFS